MNVLIFGATGKTGALVVSEALKLGHRVSVLVRDPNKLSVPGVEVFRGDATNPGDVRRAMAGQHAVIDTIGGTAPWKPVTLECNAIHAILGAMEAEQVRRLLVVTMLGLGESRGQSPFWYRYLLMPTFLRGSTRDKANVEAAVVASNADYTIVRPPLLKDDAPTGMVAELPPGKTGHQITRTDLAAFLANQLNPSAPVRRAVTVVNR